MSGFQTGRWVLLRFGASFALLPVYLIFITLHFANHAVYEIALHISDAMPNPIPFGDFDAILQAGSCWRDGINVYAPSACMHGGVYNYSPFLLWAAYLPIGPQDRFAGGLLLGATFIASLSLFPPASSRNELLVRIFTVCSSTTIYALESANFDLVIFMLSLLGILLVLTNGRMAFAGYVVFIFAAALKFYPVALLALAVRERLRSLLLIVLLIFIGGAAYMFHFASGTSTAISILPAGLPFRGVFGAINIVFGLVLIHSLPVLTLEPSVPQYFTALAHPYSAAVVGLGTRVMCIVAIVASFVIAPRYKPALERLDARPKIFFMASAMVIVFCFFAAQNLAYRGIFLIFAIPGLWLMAVQTTGYLHKTLQLLHLFIILLLWEGFFRSLVAILCTTFLRAHVAVFPEIALWLTRECLWWWVIIQLSACIIMFLRVEFARLNAEIKFLSINKLTNAQ